MEHTKRNFKGHGAHGRFFRWAKEKMTGNDAFDIFYGEKGKEYPKEMRDEFAGLFNRMREIHDILHNDRKAFMDRWKEYMPEGHDCPEGGHFEGPPFGPGMDRCGGGHGEGFPGHGHGFFGR